MILSNPTTTLAILEHFEDRYLAEAEQYRSAAQLTTSAPLSAVRSKLATYVLLQALRLVPLQLVAMDAMDRAAGAQLSLALR